MLKKILLFTSIVALALAAAANVPQYQGKALNALRPVRLKKSLQGDLLQLTRFGKDSSLRLHGLQLTTADSCTVEFEYRAKNLPAKTTGQLFILGENNQIIARFNLPSLQGDNKFHILKFTAKDLERAAAAGNTRKITGLRLDLMDQSDTGNTLIELKRLAFIGKTTAASTVAPEVWNGKKLQTFRAVRCKAGLVDDALLLSAFKRDSNINVRGLALKSADYIGVAFTYRAKNTPQKTQGQLYIINEKGKYIRLGYIPSLKADNQYHTVRIVNPLLMNQQQTISGLRLDIMDDADAGNSTVEIKDITLLPAVNDQQSSANTKLNFYGKTLLRVPPVKSKPVIDGKFTSHEWRDCSMQFGGISGNNGLMMYRWTEFFVGYDNDFFYFAHRSMLPPPPMKITLQDTLELQIAFPGAPLKKIKIDSAGNGKLLPGTLLKSFFASDNFWTTEMAIPLSALGVKKIQYGKPGKLQMIRHFQNAEEVVSFHAASRGNAFAEFIPDNDAPLVSFPTLWRNYGAPSSSYQITWNAVNNTNREQNVFYDIQITSQEQPRLIATGSKLAPGKRNGANYRGILTWDFIRHLRAEVRDPETGKIYFQRYFAWGADGITRWRDPNPPYQFKIAVYPTYQRLRALLSCPLAEKLNKVSNLEIQLADLDHKVLATFPTVRRKDGFLVDAPLPALADGEYQLIARFKNQQGKIEELSEKFAIKKFPWQNLNLGKERIIVPPFRPLQVKDRRITALLTAYNESPDGWWDEIYALDENILAQPVEFLINNQKFTVTAQRTLETSPDLVIRETDLIYKELKLTLRREYEQDGFCKVYFKFAPEKPFRIDTLTLKFPLKKSIAKNYFAAGRTIRMNNKGFIPDKTGIAFASNSSNAVTGSLNGFRPYIWLGEYRKGLAYVCESPRYWGRATGKPSQTITVGNNSVDLNLYIIDQPVVYDKPCEIVMAFQATPVKNRAAGSQAYITPAPHENRVPAGAKAMAVLSHNFCYFRYEDGLYVPPNNDWSFIEFIQQGKWQTEAEARAFIRDYFKRNNLHPRQYSLLRGPNNWCANCPMEKYMFDAAKKFKNASLRIIYGNGRVISHTWKEFDVFADEWDMRTWRPERALNEFSVEPVPSFVDFTLYQLREELKHGINGMYYDNIFESLVRDPVNTAAWEDADGTLHPAFGIFASREMVKRTAVMLHKAGKSFNGTPPIVLHMTDCPLIPVLSFAGLQLDWEMNFGNDTYQQRFPLSYGINASTGAQAGTSPMVIIDINGCGGDSAKVIRSAIAMTFIYNITNHSFTINGDPLAKAPFYYQTLEQLYRHGFGKSDTVLIPALDPANPAKIEPASVKATIARCSDGNILLLIGNLDKKTTARIDIRSLTRGEAVDLLTNKTVGKGGIYNVNIDDEAYALVLVKP